MAWFVLITHVTLVSDLPQRPSPDPLPVQLGLLPEPAGQASRVRADCGGHPVALVGPLGMGPGQCGSWWQLKRNDWFSGPRTMVFVSRAGLAMS